MTLLLTLRETAQKCSNADWRAGLYAIADALQMLIDDFADEPTADNLIQVNGSWARAEWLLKNVPPEAEPTPPQTLYGDAMGNVFRKVA